MLINNDDIANIEIVSSDFVVIDSVWSYGWGNGVHSFNIKTVRSEASWLDSLITSSSDQNFNISYEENKFQKPNWFNLPINLCSFWLLRVIVLNLYGNIIIKNKFPMTATRLVYKAYYQGENI